MSFISVSEICNEFQIDPNLDSEQMIRELKRLQAEMHPDINKKFSDADTQRFTRIEEAKDFLRKKSSQALVPISDVLEIVKLINNKDIATKRESEVIARQIKDTSLLIVKNMKQRYLPRKITVTSIWTIITLIWAFPSVVIEHPILGKFFEYNDGFLFLTLVWFCSLLLAIYVLFPIFRIESYTKSILHHLEDINVQYSLFSQFLTTISTSSSAPIEFASSDLEKFIANNIPHLSRSPIFHRQVASHIKEIIPQISSMIISHALEKGVITKKNIASWYDVYIVNT